MMDGLVIAEVSRKEYEKMGFDYRVIFNTPSFCSLNSYKVNEIKYIVIKSENKPRFGMIIGISDGHVSCPFSAPYSYPVPMRRLEKIENYDAAYKIFERFCIENGYKTIRFVLPPLFYDEHILSTWISVFYRYNFQMINLDINFASRINGRKQSGQLSDSFSSQARKHINKAIRDGMIIKECVTEADYKTAYDIVKLNHEYKHRPVHMSFSELLNTFEIVKHSAFVAYIDETKLASMILYEVNSSVVLCVYSGIMPDCNTDGAMDYLAYSVSQYYEERGFCFIDRSIGTENSIPNYGLCNFKESIGTQRSIKCSFKKDLIGQ